MNPNKQPGEVRSRNHWKFAASDYLVETDGPEQVGEASMQCPVDGETLVISERSGVEIDYCPKCRGVWLDRGELDKIIDRAGPAAPAAGYAEDRDDMRPRKKKRESFLGDLFDF